jgi:hypothetical protein
MQSGLKIEDIEIGKTYYFWVFITVNSEGYTEQDLMECVVVKKGKKKVGLQIPTLDKIKWKYPYDLVS